MSNLDETFELSESFSRRYVLKVGYFFIQLRIFDRRGAQENPLREISY